MSTQVILTHTVENVGEQGDTVQVADGFARNYLLPRGLAIAATTANLRRVAALKKQRETELAARRVAAEELAGRLGGVTCTIAAPVGADGKLFGSVTVADIAADLKAKGFDIDRKKIGLEHPIRETGTTAVEVKLHPEVITKVAIAVVASATAAATPEVAEPAPRKARAPRKT